MAQSERAPPLSSECGNSFASFASSATAGKRPREDDLLPPAKKQTLVDRTLPTPEPRDFDLELARRATAAQLRAERATAVLQRASSARSSGSLHGSYTLMTLASARALDRSLRRDEKLAAFPTPRRRGTKARDTDRTAYFRARPRKTNRRLYSEQTRLDLRIHATTTVDLRFQKMQDAVRDGIIATSPTCLVDGCPNKPRALQLCRNHYQRSYAYLNASHF